ncbi:unnamed protein product [Parajaminaea phylloscopi]
MEDDIHGNPWMSTPATTARAHEDILGETKSSVPVKRDPSPSSVARAIVPGDDQQSSSGLLLLVFIHGFKGSAETTFEDFPNRVAHVLTETHRGLHVLPVIYPTYDTRGALNVAVANLVEWLTMQVVHLESKAMTDPATGQELPYSRTGRGGGRGTVRVALLGHSMGGLVALDAALNIMGESQSDPNALWPRVVAVIAFDSPYYGVHPNVFRNQATKYISYAQRARDVGQHLAPLGAGLAAAWGINRNNQQAQQPSPSAPRQAAAGSRWTNALWAGGAFATAAAAGGVAAYYNKDQINGAYSYLTDHFQYVSNLWDDGGLKARLDALVEMPSVLFHAYYNYLPAGRTSLLSSTSSSGPRTFIVLPPLSSEHTARLFSPVETLTATDEVDAHISMFSSARNAAGYIQLVQGSAFLLGMASGGTDAATVSETSQAPDDGGRGGSSIASEQRNTGLRDDQREAQRRGEAKGPLGREEGLREGDQSLKAEEDDLLRRMADSA